ncbi:phosphopantetheine attachment site family protein [Mycobacterium ulcerans str. Harvey]|uniref:Phosphopantetheine attachment site family protein n=1 Tax=Mycobacterium ulcerans str. Harvey TaxID=1299332 RepID=A0ABP3AKC1_MYCUL|nr:phosphopantetheine attachment site family protein [Mycobacterium ulcerans str. Harvey]
MGVVCAQAATVLDYPSPNDIDPEWAFQDLGFDSVKATELLDRLQTVTELTLPPTLAFDYPTPVALATHLGQLLSGSVAVAAPVQPRVSTDEPVAVVGMACRFPGGVDSAAALWDLVAGGTEAVGSFRRTGAGTWRSCLIPIRMWWARPTPALDRLWPTSPDLTPNSSVSRRGKPKPWIPSSGCCWKCVGKRWKPPRLIRPRCCARRPGCSSERGHSNTAVGPKARRDTA